MDLTELIKLSNDYGKNEDYVLAGGGNTSLKDDKEMYIKGSGTTLATITADGFVGMDRAKLNAMMTAGYPQGDTEREAASLADMMAARLPGFEEKRPSVETTLHNLFPFRLILHVHPALVNGLTCGQDGATVAEELLPGEFVWIPLSRPGYVLSLLCRKKLAEYKEKYGKEAQILLLQNHGIFVAADTREEIDTLMNHVMERLRSKLGRTPDFSEASCDTKKAESLKRELAALYSPNGKADLICNHEILSLVASKRAFAPLAAAFTPDHIVYCKAEFLYTESPDLMDVKFREFMDKNGYAPKVVCVKDFGAFILGDTDKEIATSKMLLLDAVKIAVYSESFGGPLHMTPELIDFITNWEMEAYRQKVNKE
ncbi:class II aldolase/adducin family protein [Christensenella tenuis]|uniref:Class II aldolase n=1 Tax=Christensenella tenuis TaxID=2763033 RepID=A0ABR7EHV8_9FIRM|nr:class II aldolase/adducin family protein [Christensenella tenuis]MBC5649268.1 class II aldolase [Christensenella tenuis]